MASITATRLILRGAGDRDRTGFVDMLSDPLAREHLGGPMSRADAEASQWPSLLEELSFPEASYVVADRATDAFMGTVRLARRDPERPGHIRHEGNELELSYHILPTYWGKGYAEEATRALLSATALSHEEDEPVLAIVRSSNVRSLALTRRLGFVERTHFELHDAVQSLTVAHLSDFRPHIDTERG